MPRASSPAELHDGPAARWLHGAAWNTPATREIHRARYRHLTGCSRGVGIRLVRDRASTKVPAAELAALLPGGSPHWAARRCAWPRR
jgi:hypothetical protein